MCYELCGPDWDDEGDVQDYYRWQEEEWDADDEEPEEIEELSESEADDKFQEFVNETHEVLTIMGIDYDPARALKEIDPVAYQQEFLNWVDSEERDGRYKFPWNE